jgi:hypothetical protein
MSRLGPAPNLTAEGAFYETADPEALFAIGAGWRLCIRQCVGPLLGGNLPLLRSKHSLL